MALKDWEKDKKNLNKEYKEIRYSQKKGPAYVSVVYDGQRWRVWFYDVFDEQGEELTEKGYKKKEPAIKLAKIFMKNN